SWCQAILRPMLANIAEANGLRPIRMEGRFPYRRSPSPFAAPRFVQQKGSLPPLPTWQPSVWSSFPVPPPPLRAEVDGKTGHGRDIFFLGIAMLPRSAEITGLLKAWSGGDQTALDRLAGLVYDELHRMARHYMQDERTGKTLQTTALVNE